MKITLKSGFFDFFKYRLSYRHKSTYGLTFNERYGYIRYVRLGNYIFNIEYQRWPSTR